MNPPTEIIQSQTTRDTIQPPGTVDVSGHKEHFLVLDTAGIETQAGLMPELRAAYKRAKWSGEAIAYVIGKLEEAEDMDAKRAVLAPFMYLAPAAEAQQPE